jgi:hypothetical protein
MTNAAITVWPTRPGTVPAPLPGRSLTQATKKLTQATNKLTQATNRVVSPCW